MSLLFVLNNFMKNGTWQSPKTVYHCDKRQTSVAYRRIGMHLLSTKWTTTSSEASRPTFPKTAFIERSKKRFAWSREHLRFLEVMKNIPRYRILSTQCRFWLPAALYLGPTCIQADFFALISTEICSSS